MKKRECAIVQDLLVLYEDNMLQEESMEMVEEHIQSCEECKHIYENTSKGLSISSDVLPDSEKNQEDVAIQIMKKLTRRITYKNTAIFGVILAVILVGISAANEICDRITDNVWGIAGMIYLIPADKVEMTELYQLKNGDIYCTLKSDKKIGIRQTSDWILPNDNIEKSTDEASLEICFRQITPWESHNTPDSYQSSVIFATEREGVIEESGEKVIQRCSKISYRGKTKEDRLTIWQRGQKVQEAPEEIERKAIRAYVQEGQLQRALEECNNLGWGNEEVVRVYEDDNDIHHLYGSDDGNVEFGNDFDTILIME